VADVTRLPRNARTGLSTEHPPVHDETIASYAPFSASLRRFVAAKRRSPRLSTCNLPADVPLWCRDPTYDTPPSSHTLEQRLSHSPVRARDMRDCDTVARTYGSIRLDMRALSLYRARLPRVATLNYARCCALLSFRH